MPQRKAGPRIYNRPGRRGLFASFNRDERHIPLGTDDRAEAQLRLADLIQRRAVAGHEATKGELGPLFVAVAERARVNHSQKYAYDLNLKLEAILSWAEGHGISRIAQVNLALVERFKADKMQGDPPLKARSVNRYLDVWRKAMRLAVDEGKAPERILAAFRKLKEPRAAPHQRGLTIDELDSFLKALQDERDFWHFRMVAGSGIRDDEARHVEPGNIRDGWLVITPQPPGTCACHPRGWNTKSYRYRDIPISSATADAAAKFAAIKHSLVLDQKSVWDRLQEGRRAAGHDWHWSMHDLRRSWASHMLAAGCKLTDLSRWIGHADVMTTMRYLRVVEDNTPDPDDLPM